jgi:hypothetical protein
VIGDFLELLRGVVARQKIQASALEEMDVVEVDVAG